MKNEEVLEKFNKFWDENYSYVEKLFSDDMAIEYCRKCNSISTAANLIYDWSLANGDAEVVE